MRSLFILLISICCSFGFTPHETHSDTILGNWMSPDKDLIVNCYKVGNQYFGKIVWFKRYYDQKHGVNVAVPEDQWLNFVVMKHFVFKDDEWTDGEIYDLNSGNKYDSFIKMSGDNTLKCTGYIWFTFLGETINFTRYTDTKLPEFR